jgi:osmotically-inducible protein OsmY
MPFVVSTRAAPIRRNDGRNPHHNSCKEALVSNHRNKGGRNNRSWNSYQSEDRGNRSSGGSSGDQNDRSGNRMSGQGWQSGTGRNGGSQNWNQRGNWQDQNASWDESGNGNDWNSGSNPNEGYGSGNRGYQAPGQEWGSDEMETRGRDPRWSQQGSPDERDEWRRQNRSAQRQGSGWDNQGSIGRGYGNQGYGDEGYRGDRYGSEGSRGQGYQGSSQRYDQDEYEGLGYGAEGGMGYGSQGYRNNINASSQRYGSSGGGNYGYGSGGDYGRQEGEHGGRGPKGYRRGDDRITEDINEALTRHSGIDASDIEVQVSNGEVTLSGSVSNRQAKRMAEDVAEGVSGVKDVLNQIKVSQDNGGSGRNNQGGQQSTGSQGTSGANKDRDNDKSKSTRGSGVGVS